MIHLEPAVLKLASLVQEIKVEDLEDIAHILNQLALALRLESLRPLAVQQDLQTSLSAILRQSEPHTTDEAWLKCVFQTGRVAANLAADCDEARAALAKVDYPQLAANILGKAVDAASTRSLSISLLNLAVEGHDDVVASLSEWTSLDCLIRIASHTEEEDIRQWLWTVVEVVTSEASTDLAPSIPQETINNIEMSLIAPPETLNTILQCLDNLAQTDKVPSTLTRSLTLRLVELAEAPAEEEEAAIQAMELRIVVNLNSDLDLDHGDEFWQRMKSWVEGGRDDLRGSALLIFGNATRRDSTAKELVSLIPSVTPLLVASTADTVQHGLLGFLRNLSVLEANRQALFDAGVIDLLVEMGVWTAERDRMGSVQGGAIVILKNLCRAPEPSKAFLHNQNGTTQLLDLIKRTEEDPLRWEGTRVFAAAIRSLKGSFKPDERIVQALVDMLRTGTKHPALINEAVVALILSIQVLDTVDMTLRDHKEGGSGLEVLQRLSNETALPEEMRRNIQTLLSQLPPHGS